MSQAYTYELVLAQGQTQVLQKFGNLMFMLRFETL